MDEFGLTCSDDDLLGGFDMDAAIAAAAPPEVDAGVEEAGPARSDSKEFEDLTEQSERSKQTDEQTELSEQTEEQTEQTEQTE
jgi:hypothetical protein